VVVPPNTRGSVYIPKLSNEDFILTESGKLLWPAKSAVKDPGVLVVSDQDFSIKCLVGGGAYRFSETPSNPN
jgi:hypothetical protein